MRIAHYAPKLWSPGGIASYVRRLGRAQMEHGNEVIYFSRLDDPDDAKATQYILDTEDELFPLAQDLNLDILHLHRPVGTLPPDRVPTIRTMHGNQGSCPSGSRYLKRTGQPCNRRYTVGGCLWGHLVDHCGSRRPHKTLANFQNIHHEQQQAEEILTLTVSQFLKDQMIRSGCPPENVHVLLSAAPDIDASFSPLPRLDPPRFVFAGRLTPKKGVDWLLRAAAQVEPHVHIDIAGSGSDGYVDKLHQLVTDLDLAAQVTFHGWLDETAVCALMRDARAVVFPSVWHEPAGLITLEAAAMGRPVIASAVGGIPEYAMEDFALQVPVRDVDALAAAIGQLARSPHEAEAMGRRALHMARTQFSMERFTRELQTFYTQAMNYHTVSTHS